MTAEQQEMLEGNKLIAEFMGYVYFPFNEGDPKHFKVYGWRKDCAGSYKIKGWFLCRTHKDLPYRNDWNYLIEVVKKIKQIHFASDEGNNTYDHWRDITSSLRNLDLKELHENVVDFIKWHNQQNK